MELTSLATSQVRHIAPRRILIKILLSSPDWFAA